MAKNKQRNRAEAVRQAVDQAFQAQVPRERIAELLDDLGQTAGRLRGAVDDLRPASEAEVRTLRADVEALKERIAALERKPAPRRAPAKAGPAAKAATRKPPARRAAAPAATPADPPEPAAPAATPADPPAP
jgi:polyhydroxyalkanoate synthesis regulator phasin